MSTIRDCASLLMLVIFALASFGSAQARTETLNLKKGQSPCKVMECAEALASDFHDKIRGRHFNRVRKNFRKMGYDVNYVVTPLPRNKAAKATKTASITNQPAPVKKAKVVAVAGSFKIAQSTSPSPTVQKTLGQGDISRKETNLSLESCVDLKALEANSAEEQAKSAVRIDGLWQAERTIRTTERENNRRVATRVALASTLSFLVLGGAISLLILRFPDLFERNRKKKYYLGWGFSGPIHEIPTTLANLMGTNEPKVLRTNLLEVAGPTTSAEQGDPVQEAPQTQTEQERFETVLACIMNEPNNEPQYKWVTWAFGLKCLLEHFGILHVLDEMPNGFAVDIQEKDAARVALWLNRILYKYPATLVALPQTEGKVSFFVLPIEDYDVLASIWIEIEVHLVA